MARFADYKMRPGDVIVHKQAESQAAQHKAAAEAHSERPTRALLTRTLAGEPTMGQL